MKAAAPRSPGRGSPPAQDGRSLSGYVYQTLLDRLLRSELVPGEMLNRRDVARELGVSVAPVLEAMVALENEGFLEGIPRKGTRVRPVRGEDVAGQLIVREALECAAARLYCGTPVRARLAALRRIAARLDSVRADSPQRWEREIAGDPRARALGKSRPAAALKRRAGPPGEAWHAGPRGALDLLSRVARVAARPLAG